MFDNIHAKERRRKRTLVFARCISLIGIIITGFTSLYLWNVSNEQANLLYAIGGYASAIGMAGATAWLCLIFTVTLTE